MRFPALLLMLTLAACTDAGPERQAPLNDSLLVRALADSHLAAARAARTGEDLDSLRHASLAQIGVDTATLSRTIEIYARHPDHFLRLYDRVTDHLRHQQEQLEPSVTVPQLLPDTLQYADPDLDDRRDHR